MPTAEATTAVTNALANSTKKVASKKAGSIITKFFFGDTKTAEEAVNAGKGDQLTMAFSLNQDLNHLRLNNKIPGIVEWGKQYTHYFKKFFDDIPELIMFYPKYDPKQWAISKLFTDKRIQVMTTAQPLSEFHEELRTPIDAATYEYFYHQQQQDSDLLVPDGMISSPISLNSLILPRVVDFISHSSHHDDEEIFNALSNFCTKITPILKNYYNTFWRRHKFTDNYISNMRNLTKGYAKQSIRSVTLPHIRDFTHTLSEYHGVCAIKLESTLRRFIPGNAYRKSLISPTIGVKPQTLQSFQEQTTESVVFKTRDINDSYLTEKYHKLYDFANETTEISLTFLEYFTHFIHDDDDEHTVSKRTIKLSRLIEKIILSLNHQIKYLSHEDKHHGFFDQETIIKNMKLSTEFKKLSTHDQDEYLHEFTHHTLPKLESMLFQTAKFYRLAILSDDAMKAFLYFAEESNFAVETRQVDDFRTYLSSLYTRFRDFSNSVNLFAKDDIFHYMGFEYISSLLIQDSLYLKKSLEKAEDTRRKISACVDQVKALKRTSERKNNRSEGQKIFDLSLSVLLCTNSHYNNTYGVFKLEQCHENLIYVLAKEDHKAKQSTHHSRSLARFNSSNYSNRRNTNVPILDTTKYHRRLKSAQSLRRKRSSTDPYTASMLNHSLTDEIELRTTQAYKNYKKFSHDQRSTVKAFFGRIFANYEFSHSEPTIEKNNQEKQKIISDIDTLKKRLSTNDLSIDNSKVEMIGIFQRLKKLMNDRSTDETHSFGFYLRQEFKAIKLFQRFIHAESKNSDNENINYDSVFSDMEHHESVNSSEEDYNINSNDELTYKEPEQAPTYMQRTHSKKKKIDPPKPKKPNRSRRSRNSFSCCTSVPIQMISSDDEESKEDYSPEPKRESKQKKLRKNTPSHTKTLFNTNTACPTKNVRFNSNHNVFSHAKKSNENIEIKHPDTLYLNQHT